MQIFTEFSYYYYYFLMSYQYNSVDLPSNPTPGHEPAGSV